MIYPTEPNNFPFTLAHSTAAMLHSLNARASECNTRNEAIDARAANIKATPDAEWSPEVESQAAEVRSAIVGVLQRGIGICQEYVALLTSEIESDRLASRSAAIKEIMAARSDTRSKLLAIGYPDVPQHLQYRDGVDTHMVDKHPDVRAALAKESAAFRYDVAAQARRYETELQKLRDKLAKIRQAATVHMA